MTGIVSCMLPHARVRISMAVQAIFIPVRVVARRVLFTPAMTRVEPRKRSGLVSNPQTPAAQRRPGKPCRGARVVKQRARRCKLPDAARSAAAGVKATALAPMEQGTRRTGKLCFSPMEQRSMSKRKSQYQKYLLSGHWYALRNEAWKRDGYACVKCGSKVKLHGHHKKYRRDLRNCTVDDIETLCEKCHVGHHRQKAKERKARRKTPRVRLIMNFGGGRGLCSDRG